MSQASHIFAGIIYAVLAILAGWIAAEILDSLTPGGD